MNTIMIFKTNFYNVYNFYLINTKCFFKKLKFRLHGINISFEQMVKLSFIQHCNPLTPFTEKHYTAAAANYMLVVTYCRRA